MAPPQQPTPQPVDHAALKTNQAFIIGLTILAFIFDQPWLVLFVTLVMLAGTLRKKPGFAFVYKTLLKPRGWVQPDVIQDYPEPHQFAQGFGAVVLGAGAGFLLAGFDAPGWSLSWLVIALAALNLFGGFCAGCAVYYWLNRFDVPGFSRTSPAGTNPGRRPSGQGETP